MIRLPLATRWPSLSSAPAAVLYLLIGLMTFTGVITHLPERIAYTGDEPRYLLYSLSLALDGVPVTTESRYEDFRAAERPGVRVAQLPFVNLGSTRMPWHSITLPILLAPISAAWPLEKIRLVSLLVGLTGLFFLAKLLLNQKTNAWTAAACFAPAALCLPALPYHFLVLPEIWLFTLVAIAFWNLSSTSDGRLIRYLPSIVCSCVAPFFHLRGLALFGTVGGCVLLRLLFRADKAVHWRSVVLLGSIYSLSLAGVLFFNWKINGSMTGSAAGAPLMWRAALFAPQFWSFRAGLFTYAPIWLLSFSGLLAGIWKRASWALPSLVFLVALLITSSLGWQGESYPARFWVQAVPVLALCLLGFTQGTLAKQVKALLYGSLLIVSLTNSFLFLKDPSLHLSARSGSYPYDRLFEIFPWIHLGFWLDAFENPQIRTGIICFCVSAIIIGALASVIRSKLLATAVVIALVVGFEAHRARPLIVLAISDGPSTAVHVKNIPRPRLADVPILLRVFVPWRENVQGMLIDVMDGDSHWTSPLNVSGILYYKRRSTPSSLWIRIYLRPGATGELPAPVDREFRAMASKSFLARFWQGGRLSDPSSR